MQKFQPFHLFSAYFGIFNQFHTAFPCFLSVASHTPDLNLEKGGMGIHLGLLRVCFV